MTITKPLINPKLTNPALHTFLNVSSIKPYSKFAKMSKEVEFVEVVDKDQIQDISFEDTIGLRFRAEPTIYEGIEFLGNKLVDYDITLATDSDLDERIPILQAILKKRK